MSPSIEGTPETGWVLMPRAHGRGYATEAVRAALGWADSHLPGARTMCMIVPDNVASIGVAKKCGYEEAWRTSYKDSPVIVFSRSAPDSTPDRTQIGR
jgi:RimJ/RimL family protein N-acetyltransferase